jgi:hypothetical protein
VPLGAVGNQLANLASDFDPRTYGFRKLSDLVRRTNNFDIDHAEGRPLRIQVKQKTSGKKADTAAGTGQPLIDEKGKSA